MSTPLAAIHFTPTFGEPDRNREELIDLCQTAAGQARLVVLPELCTTGFSMNADQAAAWAESVEGPTVTALRAISNQTGAVVIVGLALRDSSGTLRNTQVVVDGATTQIYAKHHLYEADFSWATAGEAPGAVVDTSVGPVGLLICHDIVYARTVLAVAQGRPRVLALSTAWIGEPLSEDVPEAWRIVAQIVAPAPVVVANRGGMEGALCFQDPSAILTASGEAVSARSADPQILLGEF